MKTLLWQVDTIMEGKIGFEDFKFMMTYASSVLQQHRFLFRLNSYLKKVENYQKAIEKFTSEVEVTRMMDMGLINELKQG